MGQIDLLATFAALTGQALTKQDAKDSLNQLPELLGEAEAPLRTELVISPFRPKNLGLRMGKWMYIRSQGSGGFGGSKPSHHAWGGPAAAAFAGSVNSDIVDGKIRADAPPAQLYDLENDLRQTTNLYEQRPDIVEQMEAKLQVYRPE